MTEVLGVVELLGSGIVAGVLFAVAISHVPALMAMPPDRYIYSIKLLGRNWDPAMPIIVLSSTAIAIALSVIVPGASRTLFAGAAVLLIGVSIVSHYANVPINRQMKTIDPERMPEDWHDPRPLWRRWHLLRTTLAVLALLANAVAVTLV